MNQKLEGLVEASNSLMADLTDQGMTGMSEEQLREFMRKTMDPMQIKMFDLALYCETEMLKSHNAKAHVAACLMGAAMNEALISLMCLKFEAEVKRTRQFANSKKKNPSRPFRDVIAQWSLQQFNTVVEECNWIPSKVVDDIYKQALADRFRELMPVTHPEMSAEEIETGARACFEYPASALLRMAQELRNAIHAGHWLRGKRPFVAESFTMWCQFATHLCGEIRLCLFQQIFEAELPNALEKLTDLRSRLDALPQEARDMFQQMMREKLAELTKPD